MQLPLFKSLQSINIEDDKATEVVEAVEGYIAVKIAEANAPLLAELRSVRSEMKSEVGVLRADNGALKAEIGSVKWMVGAVGLLLTLIGLAPTFFKAFGH